MMNKTASQKMIIKVAQYLNKQADEAYVPYDKVTTNTPKGPISTQTPIKAELHRELLKRIAAEIDNMGVRDQLKDRDIYLKGVERYVEDGQSPDNEDYYLDIGDKKDPKFDLGDHLGMYISYYPAYKGLMLNDYQ